jgi:hypothetical protein
VRGYLNGVEAVSAAATASLSPRGNSLRMGIDGAHAQFFKGALDDLRIYSRALTVAEVASAMQTPVATTPAGVGSDATPRSVAMFAGAPNPFRASTQLGFELPAAAMVDIGVFDTSGRLVRALAKSVYPAGRTELQWDGADASGRATQPGLYFVRLRAGNTVKSIAVVRLR